MTDNTNGHLEARIEALEQAIEQQQAGMEQLETQNKRQEELLKRLVDGSGDSTGTDDAAEQNATESGAGGVPRPGRRQLMQTIGLAGLVGLGATSAAGQPQGRVGTESRPLERLYTESIDGGLTGGQAVDDLVGAGLELSGSELTAHGSWNQIEGLVAEEQLLEPREETIDGIHVDLLRTEETAMDISVGLDLYDNPTEVARFEGGGGSPPRISFGRNNTLGSWGNVSGGSGNTIDGGGSNVGGGGGNDAIDSYATVGGGRNNEASGEISTVSGGERNVASGKSSVVGGGGGKHESGDPEWLENVASGHAATVGGGLGNEATADFSTISGGAPADVEALESVEFNIVHDRYGTIGGGGNNQAGHSSDSVDAEFATVSGGEANTASGQHATIPGGLANEASGNRSFAAGSHARAQHDGSVVFGDSTATTAESQQSDEARFQMPIHPEAGLTFEPDDGDTEQKTAGPVANGIIEFDSGSNEWTEVNVVNARVLDEEENPQEVTIELEGDTGAGDVMAIATPVDQRDYPDPLPVRAFPDNEQVTIQQASATDQHDEIQFVIYRLP